MRVMDAESPGGIRFPETSPRAQTAETEAAHLSDTPEIGEVSPARPSSAVSDPLLTSPAQFQLNGFAPAVAARADWHMRGIDRGVLCTKCGGAGSYAAPASKQTGVNAPSEVAVAAGDYTRAYGAMETSTHKQGEDLPPDAPVKPAVTVRDQVAFLSAVQKADIKAGYPPTEAQLRGYFQWLKDKPPDVRQAFEPIAGSFHIHPAQACGARTDVQYSHTKVKRGQSGYTTGGPRGWADVCCLPAKVTEYASRQINDWPGDAFLSEKPRSGKCGRRGQRYRQRTLLLEQD